jgi:hypothetical protein
MQNSSSLARSIAGFAAATLTVILTGCQTPAPSASTPAAPSTAPAAAAAPAAASMAPAAVSATPASTHYLTVPVHIVAGYTTNVMVDGVTWLAGDSFFPDGETIERAGIAIVTGPDTGPAVIYQAERYSMTKFNYGPVPNGDYTVKLHFCETFEGVTAAGMRVFGYSAPGGGPPVTDFDVFATAGGGLKPVVKSIPVTVTNQTVEVDFTTQSENPQINAVEIFPGH